jgi:hypothetical protein
MVTVVNIHNACRRPRLSTTPANQLLSMELTRQRAGVTLEEAEKK